MFSYQEGGVVTALETLLFWIGALLELFPVSRPVGFKAGILQRSSEAGV